MTAVISERVARGRVVVGLLRQGWRPPALRPEQADRLLDDIRHVHGLSTLELTVRERETLELAATGLTEAQVATRIAISAETVKNRLRRGRDKLGARNTTEAVAIAVREGLIG